MLFLVKDQPTLNYEGILQLHFNALGASAVFDYNLNIPQIVKVKRHMMVYKVIPLRNKYN